MIEIGKNEYRHPFRIAVLNAQNGTRGLVDANNVIIWNDDILLALNELSQLRQERDELQKRVKELEVENKFLQECLDQRGELLPIDWKRAKKLYDKLKSEGKLKESPDETA